jgi:C-terminus of AA_permease
MILTVFLMFGLPADTWIRLAVWLAIGLLIYFAYGSRQSRIAKAERVCARASYLTGLEISVILSSSWKSILSRKFSFKAYSVGVR